MKWHLAIASAIVVLGVFAPAASAATYHLPPTGQDQWYWEISPPSDGLGGLPSVTGAYPSPGSANIWDTDMFADSNTDGGVPTGPSPVVEGLHAAGKYSICYIEAGAQQPEPDSSNFAAADYTNGSNPQTTEMQGWAGEYWYDIRGFADYVAGDPSTLSGAAVNIAAGLAKRIEDCAIEGQDALEPDDLDGYSNPSQTGAPGGGWGLTQADSAGFERWLAYTAHSDGLAIFQKNDPANAAVDEPLFDGMIIEECNFYNDPCAGSGGDGTPYLDAGKPVLNAEYTDDGETTARFCPADTASGITGALFDVNLDGKTYEPCAPVGQTTAGGTGGGGDTGTGGGGDTGTGGGGDTGSSSTSSGTTATTVPANLSAIMVVGGSLVSGTRTAKQCKRTARSRKSRRCVAARGSAHRRADGNRYTHRRRRTHTRRKSS
jgi:Glycoside-hydrolase family GH114